MSWHALDDITSGVRQVWYCFDGGEKYPLGVETDGTEILDLTGLADGEHTLKLGFEDYAGNVTSFKLIVCRDVTAPAVELLSPTDASAVNGIVELWGTIRDTSLDNWRVTATGEEGRERVLASGTGEMDAEMMAILNCAGYGDGETVKLRILAEDKAGNSSSVTGAVIVVDKSAAPVEHSVQVTSPENTAVIDSPRITGSYRLEDGQQETEGFLYIDGVYAGECTGGEFEFEAITRKEGSMHSLSVLTRTEEGGLGFSQGLSTLVLLSDAFEDEGYLETATGVSLGNGATTNGGSGTLVARAVSVSYPLLALRLSVTERKPGGTDIQYFYSLDGGEWTALSPETAIPLLAQPESIRVKAELSGSGAASPTLLVGRWRV